MAPAGNGSSPPVSYSRAQLLLGWPNSNETRERTTERREERQRDRQKEKVGGGWGGGRAASEPGRGGPARPHSAQWRDSFTATGSVAYQCDRQTDLFGSFGGCERRWTTVSLTTEGWRHPQMQFSDEWRATRAGSLSSCVILLASSHADCAVSGRELVSRTWERRGRFDSGCALADKPDFTLCSYQTL
ncbi:hypothetical protein BKA81DRAFT_426508 [Phyllosticta paracitricarpa]